MICYVEFNKGKIVRKLNIFTGTGTQDSFFLS